MLKLRKVFRVVLCIMTGAAIMFFVSGCGDDEPEVPTEEELQEEVEEEAEEEEEPELVPEERQEIDEVPALPVPE